MRRSPSVWSIGDQVQVPTKVLNFMGGCIAVAPAQVGEIVSVAPLKVRVDLYADDSRNNFVEARYEWDEISSPK